MNELKINIGAGKTYIPDFTNIDISDKADITLDLSSNALPFEDNSVDLIFTYHCLEHVENYLYALREIHRVLKHGGILLIGVPYVTLTEHNLVNPYHRHHFNEYSFDFFNAKLLKGSAAEENPILFRKIFHRFHYIGAFHLTPPPLRKWCRRHLFNVVRKIDFGLVAIKDPHLEVKDAYSKAQLKKEFLHCLDLRRPYTKVRQQKARGWGVARKARGMYRSIDKWWHGNSL